MCAAPRLFPRQPSSQESFPLSQTYLKGIIDRPLPLLVTILEPPNATQLSSKKLALPPPSLPDLCCTENPAGRAAEVCTHARPTFLSCLTPPTQCRRRHHGQPPKPYMHAAWRKENRGDAGVHTSQGIGLSVRQGTPADTAAGHAHIIHHLSRAVHHPVAAAAQAMCTR